MADRAADLVARSLEQVAERGDPATHIYARLFAELPESEALFVNDRTGAARGEMLAMAFQCLLDPGGPYQAALVRAERGNHDGFGVPPELFDRFFGVVRRACRDILGAAWTGEVDAAWDAQLARLGVPAH